MNRTALIVALALCGAYLLPAPASAGEGFFQKIGDGWRQGKWIPGFPDPLKPVPPNPNPPTAQPGTTNVSAVAVSYRVNCRDRDNGRDRGDETLTVTAPNRAMAVNEILRLAATTELCQRSGDASRITVAGSGHFLN